MTLELEFFNIWAVLVAIVSNMIIGTLWYSPILFGKIWFELIGKTAEDISNGDSSKAMKWTIVPAVVSSLSLALILGILGISSLIDGFLVSLLLSVGFIGMSGLNLVIFEERSMKLNLLTTGFSVVSMFVASIIISLWH